MTKSAISGDVDDARAVFVSPHFDDVALSCGGTVAKLAGEGASPVIVTCFTEAPDAADPVADLARQLHQTWGVQSGHEIVAVRRGEEAAAARELDARTVWLAYREAIYRGTDYGRPADLFSVPVASDAELQRSLHAQLLQLWLRTDRADVYLPLAVGGHVDHRICFGAASVLRAAGATVRCYEDFPYCAKPGSLSRRLAVTRVELSSEVVDITRWLERRIAAIACYVSQHGLLFGDLPFSDATRRYAREVGSDGSAGERFWRWP